MAQAMAEKENPHKTPGEDEPTGRSVGGAVVHIDRTRPTAAVGHDEGAEGSNADVGSRR